MRGAAALRRLDLALEEVHGRAEPPDLRYRILSASPDERRAAAGRFASTKRRARARRRLGAAAPVALGVLVLGALIAFDRFATRSEFAVTHAQDRAATEVIPDGPAHLAELLESLVDVRVRTLVSVRGMIPLYDARSAASLPDADRDHLGRVLSQQDQFADPASMHARMISVELHLEGRRFIPGHVEWLGGRAFQVEGVGELLLSREVAGALHRAAHEAEMLARHELGIVIGGEDLRRMTDDQSPPVRELRGFDLTSDDLALLPRLSGLRSLDLAGSPLRMTPQGIEHIAAVPALESLSVRASQLPVEGVGALARIPDLRELGLSGATVGRASGLTSCHACHMPRAARVAPLRDLDLAPLREIGGLRVLRLHDLTVPASVQDALTELPMLRTLDLSDCSIDDLDFESVARTPALEELVLARSQGVTAGVLRTIATMKQLRVLDLRGVENLDTVALFALRKALPRCDIQLVPTDGH